MSFFQQAIEKNLSRCQAEECQQAFLALANGDPHGKIHPSQVEYGFQTLGFEITKEEVKELAKQLDRDQDDRLDWHDFQRLYLSKSQQRTDYELFQAAWKLLETNEANRGVALEQLLDTIGCGGMNAQEVYEYIQLCKDEKPRASINRNPITRADLEAFLHL